MEFTRYTRPHGQREQISIERPADVEHKARQIVEAGYRFEVETLSTGHVSLTIHDPRAQEDVAIRLVDGGGLGTIVPKTIDELVVGFQIPGVA